MIHHDPHPYNPLFPILLLDHHHQAPAIPEVRMPHATHLAKVRQRHARNRGGRGSPGNDLVVQPVLVIWWQPAIVNAEELEEMQGMVDSQGWLLRKSTGNPLVSTTSCSGFLDSHRPFLG